MATYRPQLPTRKQAWMIASFVLCFVNIFALVSIFDELPSFLIRYLPFDTISVIAYSLTFALVESIFTSLVVLVINALLPFKVEDRLYVLRGIWISLLIFAIPLALNDPVWRLLVALAGLLGSGALLILVKKTRDIAYDVIDRLSLLGGLLLFLNVASLIIIVVRKVTR